MITLEELSESEFKKAREQKIYEIDEELKNILPAEVSFQKTVLDAMEYSLLGEGKRLRPMFMKEMYAVFSETTEQSLTYFMGAIELIHTYSLVHDDLPAMDNDDFRRGRKTTHKVFGEDMGILCGDALLNYAFEIAIKGAGECRDKNAALSALSVLANKAGIFGMVGGQVVDVEQTGKPLTKEQLLFIYELKTGALLEAAFMIGAILSGASDGEIKKAEKIGSCIGMAFQIQDDILDLTGTTEMIGKPAHSDERNEKTTYVSVYGMELAKKAVAEYSEQALQILAELAEKRNRQNKYLNTLVRALIDRKK